MSITDGDEGGNRLVKTEVSSRSDEEDTPNGDVREDEDDASNSAIAKMGIDNKEIFPVLTS